MEDRLSSAMKLLGVGNPFPEGTGELLQLQLLTKFGKEGYINICNPLNHHSLVTPFIVVTHRLWFKASICF